MNISRYLSKCAATVFAALLVCGCDMSLTAPKVDPYLFPYFDKKELPAEGGTIHIQVKTNQEFTIGSDAEWLKRGEAKVGEVIEIDFVASPNEEPADRKAKIRIGSPSWDDPSYADISLEVTQKAAPAPEAE